MFCCKVKFTNTKETKRTFHFQTKERAWFIFFHLSLGDFLSTSEGIRKKGYILDGSTTD